MTWRYGNEADRLTPAEYRELFRVSVGTLPNRNKVEILSSKITAQNWNALPSLQKVRAYLHELYGSRVTFLYESKRTEGDVLVFEYTE